MISRTNGASFEREARLQRKRDEFEKALKLYRHDLKQWVRYAQLEIDAGEYSRARSIFERALEVDYTSVMLWHHYSQFEKKHTSYSLAVRVLERAVKLLPREDGLWQNLVSYSSFNNKEFIYEQWSKYSKNAWPHWYRWARSNAGDRDFVLKKWVDYFLKYHDINAWVNEAQKVGPEVVQSAIEILNPELSAEISEILEKQRATKVEESGICTLKDSISLCGDDIDLWWATLNVQSREDLFQTALSVCKPLLSPEGKTEKWRQYARLWVRYANFKETEDERIKVYETALMNYDHSKFSSATLWREYALCFVRKGDIPMARKAFGSALGKTKKAVHSYMRIITEYINMERDLRDYDRCRKLFRMLVLTMPSSPETWIRWAKFEHSLNEEERYVSLFEMAINMHKELRLKDTNELYYAWADTEFSAGIDKSRYVWESLVKSGHASSLSEAYMQYAMFEVGINLDLESGKPTEDAVMRARRIFKRGMLALDSGTEEFEDLKDYFDQFEERYGDVTKATEFIEGEDFVLEGTDESEAGDEEMDMEDSEHEAEPTANDELTPLQKLLAKAKKWNESKSLE